MEAIAPLILVLIAVKALLMTFATPADPATTAKAIADNTKAYSTKS